MEYYKGGPVDRKVTEKRCERCGKEFLAKNKRAKFCGTSCKQQSYIENKEMLKLTEEINEREQIIPGLELLLESNPNDIELQKLILLNKGKLILLKDQMQKLKKPLFSDFLK